MIDDNAVGLRWYRHYLRSSIFTPLENVVHDKTFVSESERRINPNLTHIEWIEIVSGSLDSVLEKYNRFTHETWTTYGIETENDYLTDIKELGGLIRPNVLLDE